MIIICIILELVIVLLLGVAVVVVDYELFAYKSVYMIIY